MQAEKNDMRLITFLLTWPLTLLLVVAQDTGQSTPNSARQTNAPVVLVEGPNDNNIVKLTAEILRRQHYLRRAINDETSSKFLDRYLDALDNLHLYFIQADLNEFEQYRTVLDNLLIEKGDTVPARVIFTRFRERVEQQYQYVTNLLQAGKFDFTGDDRFTLNRRTLPRPKDIDEARQLWRDRLRFEYLQEKLNKEPAAEIVRKLTHRYNQIRRTIRDYDNDDVLQIYLTALAHVYDPHSDYMGKSGLENFSIDMKLSLFGIGATLRSEDGICKIVELVPGSPAAMSRKLKANDKIIAVAQSNLPPVDVMEWKLNKVVEQIRGPKGTEVRLTVVAADATDLSDRQVVTLIRDEIKLEEKAAKASVYEIPSGKGQTVRLGVIDLPSFYSGFELEGRKNGGEQKSTTTDVARLLKKLTQEKVAGIVLDLRRNGGGSLEEAINLTGLFIKEGPVVQVKDSTGRVFVDNDPDPAVWYDGPLVVLTGRFSASASEILAGALQDYGRALIVGDSSTHGKGTVQSLIQLGPILRQSGVAFTNNPGAVKVTIRKFYRASGSSTQLKGVVPDVILDSVNNHFEVGEASLDNAMEWDVITSANYDNLNRIQPLLPELKRRSQARVAGERDFVFVREEVERYKKNKAEKSISLNEAQRLKEKKEADDRAKARKKELASRPPPPGKVFEVTLKNVDLPGLLPPEPKTNIVSKAAPGEPVKRTQTTKKENNKDKPKPPGRQVGTGKSAPGQTAATKGNPRSAPKSDDEDEEPDDSVAAVDVTLDETKRILTDLIALANSGNALAGKVPAGVK